MTPAALKAWRKHLRLSQKAAAGALGRSRAMYQRYEAGQDPIPLMMELACASIALGIRSYDGPPERKPA